MFNVKFRRPKGPDVEQPKMSRRARRQAEKIELRKKAELAALTIERRKLEVTRELDAYSAELADQAQAKKANRTAAARAAIAARFHALGDRLANDRPLLAAVIVSSLCLVTAIVGQVMFYKSLPWPSVFGFLVVVLPFVVEGGSWTFAINAQYLASRQLPYGADTRKMWLFAAAAAAMNGYHGAVTLKEPVTGVILGGASLIGPYIWHRYVNLTKTSASGWTGEQIRAAFGRRINHPFLSRRAWDIWSASGGTMNRETAWRLAWMQAKGAAPGMAPATSVAPVRNQWLFRLLFGRVVNPAVIVTKAAATRRKVAPLPPVQPTDIPDKGVAEQPATEDAVISDEEIATFLAEWSASPEQPETPSSTEVAQPLKQPTKPASNPRPEQPEQPNQQGATTAADRVAQYFHEQVAAGVAPERVSATDAGKVAGCSRQAADKVLKRLRNPKRSERG